VSALALMRDLQAAGVVLEAHDGRLKVDAPVGILTPQIRDSLARHKLELLAVLSAAPAERKNWTPLDVPVAWTDRADVIAVVEDLADGGERPRRIARTFGLTADEVLTILRRSGR
jgi:hypothetical protein